MRYLQFAEASYGGKKVVKRIGGSPPIDPEETKKNVATKLHEIEEFEIQENLAKKKKSLIDQQYRLLAAYNKLFNPLTGEFIGDAKKKNKIITEYGLLQPKLNEIEEAIIANSEKYDISYRKLLKKYAVYSTPKNSKLIRDDEVEDWIGRIKKTNNGEFLLEDKSTVSEKEIEKDQIKNMSMKDKAREKQNRIKILASKALIMRQQLELEGNSDALEKSKAWYGIEKDKIEKLYE